MASSSMTRGFALLLLLVGSCSNELSGKFEDDGSWMPPPQEAGRGLDGARVGPEASVVNAPDAFVANMPEASVPSTPDASVPSTPDASVPNTPDASVPSTPDASVPNTPDASVPTGPPPIAKVSDLLSEQLIVKTLWRGKAGSDYVTTASRAEASTLGGAVPVFYVPSTNASKRQALYRLFNGSTDHMDSLVQGEGGYATEGTLGYPWRPGQGPLGAVQLVRGNAAGNHALMHGAARLTGFADEPLGVFGWARRPGAAIRCIQGSEIKLCSNLQAGGVVWNLQWNGREFLDTHDYGRELQASLNVYGALPTEGGDVVAHHFYGTNKSYWHGSPTVQHSISGKTQETRAVPLEWYNRCFSQNAVDPKLPSINCDQPVDQVVAYKDWLLGKDVTLDPQVELGAAYNHLRAQIVRYDTVFSTPRGIKQAHIEIPTGYHPASFSRYFVIDARKADLNEGLTEVARMSHQQPTVVSGGVVVASQDLKYAIGVYGKQASKYAGYNYFTLRDYGSVRKWSHAYFGEMPAGVKRFRSYIVVGTLDEVRVAMRRLHVHNASL